MQRSNGLMRGGCELYLKYSGDTAGDMLQVQVTCRHRDPPCFDLAQCTCLDLAQ